MLDLAASQRLFDPDSLKANVIALRVDVRENSVEQATHKHRKGQLVLAERGSVTCHIERGLWMVPPDCGVWIPGGMEHSNRVSVNGKISLLFVEPGAARLPEQCCTLSISPLLRELVVYLAAQPQDYSENGPTGRVACVLLEQLVTMPEEELYLPMPTNSRLTKIAKELIKDPSNRNTVGEWARQVAMSERTLARLAIAETGMTFGRWRRQLHIILALQKLSAGQPVQRVAELLGYDSVSAFITMFRNALGKTPGSYMRKPDH